MNNCKSGAIYKYQNRTFAILSIVPSTRTGGTFLYIMPIGDFANICAKSIYLYSKNSFFEKYKYMGQGNINTLRVLYEKRKNNNKDT